MYTLLIADDEADERALIRFLLKDFSPAFHLLEASNGRDALALLQSRHVDILISDVQMPFLNGIELAVKARELTPDIEVLFFSGYDDFSYVKTALTLKAVNYILKPVNPEEFYKSMSETVEHLNSQRLEFSKSEQYIEAHFHDTMPPDPNDRCESMPLDQAASQLMQDIRAALRMKQAQQLSQSVHTLLNRCLAAPKLSHIYIRYICTTLLQLLVSVIPDFSDEDLQNAVKEVYSFRHFSDIIKLIEHYLSLAVKTFEQEQNASNYAVYQVEQYIRMHYNEDLSLTTLASLVYLNPNYLSNIFAQVTGCTLNKYIKQVRMEKAQDLLLTTNMKISDISQSIGYPNVSYFCKAFQKMFGTTPERFRKGAE